MNNFTYKDIMLKVISNTRADIKNTELLNDIKGDIVEVMIEAHGISQAPRKVVSFNVDEGYSITEDFADANLIEGLSLTGVNVANGKAQFFPGEGKKIIFLPSVYNLQKISFIASGVAETSPHSPSPGYIKVYNAKDEELFAHNFLADVTPTLIEVEPAIHSVGMKVEIGITCDTSITENTVDDLSFTFVTDSLQLPSDFFLPFETVFSASTIGKTYVSSELLAEDWLRWRPNRIFLPEQPVDVTNVERAAVYSSTEENLLHDGKIGFYYDTNDKGAFLRWKPKFSGIITIYFSYLPSMDVSDGAKATIHVVFAAMLIAGVTHRQLLKRIATSKNEVESIGIRVALSEYKKIYDRNLATYAGWVNRQSETHIMKPFGFLNDLNMELLK
jgi:hypothetical protein